MVDPNCRPTATRDVAVYRERMARVLDRADIVKGSDEDFAFLALAETPEASARLLLDRGVGAVIVTQGAQPARAWCAGGAVVVPVPAVEVVDTVGAGDAFGGAFLARWLEQGLGREQLDDRDRPGGCRVVRRPCGGHQLHPCRRRASHPLGDGPGLSGPIPCQMVR